MAPGMTFPASGVETALWVPPLVAFAVSFLCSMGGVSGAFLLLPVAVQLSRVARSCLGTLGKGKAVRLVLSLFFKAALGIQRVFHFETLDDAGFAILTGANKVLGRNTLGGLVRAAPIRGVLRFVRKTAPRVKQAITHAVSLDEHTIARFTRKFSIRKGFHTIRNKKMKVDVTLGRIL